MAVPPFLSGEHFISESMFVEFGLVNPTKRKEDRGVKRWTNKSVLRNARFFSSPTIYSPLRKPFPLPPHFFPKKKKKKENGSTTPDIISLNCVLCKCTVARYNYVILDSWQAIIDFRWVPPVQEELSLRKSSTKSRGSSVAEDGLQWSYV